MEGEPDATGLPAGAAARRSVCGVWRPGGSERAWPAYRGHRTDQRIQDVDGSGDPVLHAGAQRAVPSDLRGQPAARRRAEQYAAAGEGLHLQVRCWFYVLGAPLDATTDSPRAADD